ncbi:MAG: cytochrome c-type biogenesis protein CcmH [Alphaproteobacteria bacterium]|nr:cytochrome c-type biogenesis protein CcmH [Alphaproteobacteria bacterium]
MRVVVLAALILLQVAPFMPAGAVNPDEMLADPVQEARARELSKDLRCLVCQNQSIDDSNASLARDLRVVVRERIKAGDSDSQVMRYVRDRYGDFVLLKPPVQPSTYALWFGPLLFAILGMIGVTLFMRRRPASLAPPALSEAERRRVELLLAEVKDGDGRLTP